MYRLCWLPSNTFFLRFICPYILNNLNPLIFWNVETPLCISLFELCYFCVGEKSWRVVLLFLTLAIQEGLVSSCFCKFLFCVYFILLNTVHIFFWKSNFCQKELSMLTDITFLMRVTEFCLVQFSKCLSWLWLHIFLLYLWHLVKE